MTFERNRLRVAVDLDGSVLGCGGRNRLVRHAPDGSKLPVWPTAPPPPAPSGQHNSGLFSRLFGASEPARSEPVRSEPVRSEPGVPSVPDWAALPHRINTLPESALFTIGADGRLYLVHDQLAHFAVYDRKGQLLESMRAHGPPGCHVVGLGADGQGNLFVLTLSGGGGRVFRAPPGSQLRPWLGAQSGRPGRLGESNQMVVLPDGCLHIANGFGSLRFFDAAGNAARRT